MRDAFSMIEIIFVIVIIGALAAIAIPKLSAKKDDASAAFCVSEVGVLINEINRNYVARGYKNFSTMSIGNLTNIPTDVDTYHHGILENHSVVLHTSGITYACEGEAIVKLKTHFNNSKKYVLTIKDQSPISPAARKAANKLRNIYHISQGLSRVYIL